MMPNTETTAPGRRRGRPRSHGKYHCDRCQQPTARIVARWPEGAICYPCYSAATRTHGTCSKCSRARMLPGRDDSGKAICVDCAGLDLDLHCRRCGWEEERYRADLCARCALRDDLEAILRPHGPDDPRQRFADALTSAERPHSILIWMRADHVTKFLTAIGTRKIELSHDGLDALPSSRHIEHVRAIAIHHGVLPERDPNLPQFERWLGERLDQHQAARLPDLAALTKFARWHHLRRIRQLPASKTNAAVRSAKQEITVAGGFLTDLTQHKVRLARLGQRHIDDWLAPGPTTRYQARTFVVWAIKHNLCPRTLNFPHRSARTRPAIDDDHRLAMIRRCLTDEVETLPYRVAAILLLVYAQPLVRIAALRCDDLVIDIDTGRTYLRLGEPPSPIPEPFAAMLHALRGNRPNLNTGTKDSPWLFPSTRAGQHIAANTILHRLRDLGLDRLAARSGAIRQLVTRTPPAVVATMLGYSHQVTERHAEQAGNPFASYARLINEQHTQ